MNVTRSCAGAVFLTLLTLVPLYAFAQTPEEVALNKCMIDLKSTRALKMSDKVAQMIGVTVGSAAATAGELLFKDIAAKKNIRELEHSIDVTYAELGGQKLSPEGRKLRSKLIGRAHLTSRRAEAAARCLDARRKDCGANISALLSDRKAFLSEQASAPEELKAIYRNLLESFSPMGNSFKEFELYMANPGANSDRLKLLAEIVGGMPNKIMESFEPEFIGGIGQDKLDFFYRYRRFDSPQFDKDDPFVKRVEQLKTSSAKQKESMNALAHQQQNMPKFKDAHSAPKVFAVLGAAALLFELLVVYENEDSTVSMSRISKDNPRSLCVRAGKEPVVEASLSAYHGLGKHLKLLNDLVEGKKSPSVRPGNPTAGGISG